MSAIARVLAKSPDAALLQVYRAPGEYWCSKSIFDSQGRRCLLGHLTHSTEYTDVVRALKINDGTVLAAAIRFDALVRRFGLLRVVRAVQARAWRELEARAQLELELAS